MILGSIFAAYFIFSPGYMILWLIERKTEVAFTRCQKFSFGLGLFASLSALLLLGTALMSVFNIGVSVVIVLAVGVHLVFLANILRSRAYVGIIPAIKKVLKERIHWIRTNPIIFLLIVSTFWSTVTVLINLVTSPVLDWDASEVYLPIAREVTITNELPVTSDFLHILVGWPPVGIIFYAWVFVVQGGFSTIGIGLFNFIFIIGTLALVYDLIFRMLGHNEMDREFYGILGIFIFLELPLFAIHTAGQAHYPDMQGVFLFGLCVIAWTWRPKKPRGLFYLLSFLLPAVTILQKIQSLALVFILPFFMIAALIANRSIRSILWVIPCISITVAGGLLATNIASTHSPDLVLAAWAVGSVLIFITPYILWRCGQPLRDSNAIDWKTVVCGIAGGCIGALWYLYTWQISGTLFYPAVKTEWMQDALILLNETNQRVLEETGSTIIDGFIPIWEVFFLGINFLGGLAIFKVVGLREATKSSGNPDLIIGISWILLFMSMFFIAFQGTNLRYLLMIQVPLVAIIVIGIRRLLPDHFQHRNLAYSTIIGLIALSTISSMIILTLFLSIFLLLFIYRFELFEPFLDVFPILNTQSTKHKLVSVSIASLLLVGIIQIGYEHPYYLGGEIYTSSYQQLILDIPTDQPTVVYGMRGVNFHTGIPVFHIVYPDVLWAIEFNSSRGVLEFIQQYDIGSSILPKKQTIRFYDEFQRMTMLHPSLCLLYHPSILSPVGSYDYGFNSYHIVDEYNIQSLPLILDVKIQTERNYTLLGSHPEDDDFLVSNSSSIDLVLYLDCSSVAFGASIDIGIEFTRTKISGNTSFINSFNYNTTMTSNRDFQKVSLAKFRSNILYEQVEFMINKINLFIDGELIEELEGNSDWNILWLRAWSELPCSTLEEPLITYHNAWYIAGEPLIWHSN